MAVYTHVSDEALATFLAGYDRGTLIAASGIAEGVENSNYLVETTAGRFVLTLYERRVSADDLPFFLSMTAHLADRGCPVPAAIRNRAGEAIGTLAMRPACLFEFLSGLSPTEPTPAEAKAAGAALATMHQALRDFALRRANDFGVTAWRALLQRCGRAIDGVEPGFHDRIEAALSRVEAGWPRTLPQSAIHADLFPDNVLMKRGQVTGLIDFYFACTDVIAYDLAVMHGAWAFDRSGRVFDAEAGAALMAGYEAVRPLSEAERRALPLLAEGACLRFVLTRAWDWLNTPSDALVTRKDPLAYWRRLEAYRAGGVFG